MPSVQAPEIQTFWNDRAKLGPLAGTRDIIAKQIEMRAIARHVKDGMRVLDVGCGNGVTAIELARRFAIDCTGVDYAEEMVHAARRLAAAEGVERRVRFAVGDVLRLDGEGPVDLAYTERTLINLPDWETQRQAIAAIGRTLRPGGRFVMCENSQDGLDAVNALRVQVGLEAIAPPWHNRYLRQAEIEAGPLPGLVLEGVEHYSSTYYLVSRVLNARLAQDEGREPDYESPLNRLAAELPAVGDLGQGKIWRFRREETA